MMTIFESSKPDHLFCEFWAFIDEPLGSDITMIESS